MKDESVSLPKPHSQVAQLHDDDEDVFATSLINRYAARPVSLQNMCLGTFAVTYVVIQSATKKEKTDGINDEEEEIQNTETDNSVTRMKLQKGLHICYLWFPKGNIASIYIWQLTAGGLE